MSNVKNYIWGGLAGLAGFALLKASQLSNLAKEFIIESSTRIHSVNLSELVVAVDILFKNPTDGTISLKHPLIAVYDSPESLAQNKPIQTSEVSGQYYTIAPNAQTKLAPVYIKLPVSLNTVLTAWGWISTYLRGEPVHLIGRATTTVNGLRVEKLLPVSIQQNPPVTLACTGAAYSDPAGVKIRLKLTAINAKSAAQTLSVRVAIYATETDRQVDAPLWFYDSPGTITAPGSKTSQLLLTDGLIKTAQLAAYPKLSSVLVQSSVVSGNRTAQLITQVNLQR